MLESCEKPAGIAHARRHLRGWMRPERKGVSIFFRPGSARLIKQTLGVVGVIVP